MNTADYPNEVVIPFPNPISEQYQILACENDPVAGNGRHAYKVLARNKNDKIDWTQEIRFQKGPLPDVGHNGIGSNVYLQILIDHLKAFQTGQYGSRETAIAITHLEEAENWLARRSSKRQAQGILGKHAKEAE